MGVMGVAGAALAGSPTSLFAKPMVVPAAVIQSGRGLNIALVQRVQGKMKDTPYAPQALIPLKPEQMAEGYMPPEETRIEFEQVEWPMKHMMTVTGVRVWGAKVCGERWTKYAAFSADVTVNSSDTLKVNYTITADYKPVNPFQRMNRDEPA